MPTDTELFARTPRAREAKCIPRAVRAGSPAVAKRSRFDWLLSLQSSLPSGAQRTDCRLSRILLRSLRPAAEDRQESRPVVRGQCFSCSTQVHASSLIKLPSVALTSERLFLFFYVRTQSDYLCCCRLHVVTERQVMDELRLICAV